MEGDHPACTERRNEVEEGRGNRPGRASAVPCAAPGGSAPKQPAEAESEGDLDRDMRTHRAVSPDILTIVRSRAIYLVKSVSIGYTSDMTKKDVGLRIRLDRDLRDEFVAACQVHDRPAAQVLREFMREYVRESVASSAVRDPQRESRGNEE